MSFTFGLSAQSDGDDSVAQLRAEVESLSDQNAALIAALKDQLARFEEQQSVVESLAQRVEELESSRPDAGAPLEQPMESQPTLEDQMALLEVMALAESEAVDLEEPALSFGGWAGFAYTDDDRESTKAGFDAHPLYVYAKASPADNWTFFGELEFEHLFKSSSSGTKGDLKVERLYIEHQLKDGARVRAGKFFLPFGYWYNLHWHFLTETLSRPISFNNSYVPKQQVGIEYLNTASFGDTHLNYTLWLGDGPDIAGTNKRSESDFSIGGSVFAERSFSNGVSIGGTLGFHQQKVDFDKEQSYVLGGKLSAGDFDFRAEFYRHNRELSEDLDTAYTSLQYNLSDTFGLVWRHDFGDDIKTSGDALVPDTKSDSLGFVWRPQPYLLFKSEYRINQFDTSGTGDYDNWNFFSAIKF